MALWRKWIPRYKAISWLLVAALFVQLLTQLHLHLHHVDIWVPQQHEHVVDYHMIGDLHAVEHTSAEDVHEIKSTPLVIVKKLLDNDNGLILSTCLLLLLPLLVQSVNRQKLQSFHTTIKSQYYALSPPLRAPPAV